VIRLSAHLSTLFPDVPELERPTAARSLGFTTVETWWPAAADRDAWVAAVSAASVRAVLVNADGGDLAAGERGFCTVAERHDEVVASVRDALELARACGGTTVNLLAGRIDPAIPEEAQRAAALDAVRASADEAVRLGGRVVIEHLNAHDVVRPLLPTPAAAAAFVRDADHEGVRLLFDAYHAHRAGLDPIDALGEVADVLGHVQYSDSPGRGAPGTGEIDLARLVDRLDELGYDGHVGLEFTPAGSSLGWLPKLAPAFRRGAKLG
jgi:hydroxypyruvate isomerase